MPEDDDVALKLVHTADWHLGKRFPSFSSEAQEALMRARMSAVDSVLGVAQHENADALLCAGDLFDDPNPTRQWWEPLAEKFARHGFRERPIFLLPGNHDPLTSSSVYAETEPFRRMLPPWVHVVDRDDFEFALCDEAVLYAVPCRSRSGRSDLTARLPARDADDRRIRIGLIHGQTFDEIECQTNFPIAKDAAIKLGLDYLAIGDTHSFRCVPPDAAVPTVYPSAPEPTNFGETDSGYVAVVSITRRTRKAHVARQRVAHYTWERVTCRSLGELQALHDRNLRTTVLDLRIEMNLPADEYAHVERLLARLEGTPALPGRAAIVQLDRSCLGLDTGNIEAHFATLPDVLQGTVRRLKALEAEQGEQGQAAKLALYHLYDMTRERTR
jgi:DNA repair exonuclease SbcCD nuclease subunit